MSRSPTTKVLAVGLDGADWRELSRQMAAGRMPNLQSLALEGSYAELGSPESTSSLAAWVEFVCGVTVEQHGVNYEWLWDPSTMSVRRPKPEQFRPFWASKVDAGGSVGVLDVPYAGFLGFDRGWEALEWAAHDSLFARPAFSPPWVAERASAWPTHHLTAGRALRGAPSHATLAATAKGCIDGIPIRGALAAELLGQEPVDLALVNFPETHHLVHYIWHGAEPDDPMYRYRREHDSDGVRWLQSLARALDEQLGRLSGLAESLVVFSLHGMRACNGITTLLPQWLEARGYAVPLSAGSARARRPSELAWAALAAVKRRGPAWLASAYHRAASTEVQRLLARPTIVPPRAWERTRAFALPTDRDGWVRVNLVGRERDGIVNRPEFEPLLDEISAELLSLRTRSGAQVVKRVSRVDSAGGVMANPLPDLVVTWAPGVYEEPLYVDDLEPPPPVAPARTGEHDGRGFLVATGPAARLFEGPIRSHEMAERLLAASR